MGTFNRFGTFNAVLPKEGPQVYPCNLDFRTAGEQTLDFSQEIIAEHVSYISGFYVDNSANANDLVISVATTNQSIRIPAGKQAYMPVLAPSTAEFTFTTDAAADLTVPVFACNFPVWPCVF